MSRQGKAGEKWKAHSFTVLLDVKTRRAALFTSVFGSKPLEDRAIDVQVLSSFPNCGHTSCMQLYITASTLD